MELIEKAENYAAGKAIEALTKAIAQAYEEGYRDGYKNREEEEPLDLRYDKTEYVDLGLPSGTLWSKDYEKENGETLYLPYGKAAKYTIPTEEQWNELLEYSRRLPQYDGFIFSGVTFVGSNGNSIYLRDCGYKQDKKEVVGLHFWILDNGDNIEKNSIHVDSNIKTEIVKSFSGYRLPLRLVCKK